MQCPKDKSAMRTIPVQNSTFDTCDACGGVWFDEGELKKIARVFAWGIPAQVEEFALVLKENDVSVTSHESRLVHDKGITCPLDGTETERFVYAGDSEIILDRCPKCHGTWFDGDELVRLAEYLKPRARDLMGKLMVMEMKSTVNMNEGINLLPLLPLKIAGRFSSPMALAASVLSFLVTEVGFDLGFDSKLYK